MGNGVLKRSDLWQWRRIHAWRLSRRGWKQRDIADAFDVSEGAVSHWLAAARLEGKAALMARPRPGRPGKLTLDQLRLIPDFLGHGAEAYGFRGKAWTTARIAKVIQEEFAFPFTRPMFRDCFVACIGRLKCLCSGLCSATKTKSQGGGEWSGRN